MDQVTLDLLVDQHLAVASQTQRIRWVEFNPQGQDDRINVCNRGDELVE